MTTTTTPGCLPSLHLGLVLLLPILGSSFTVQPIRSHTSLSFRDYRKSRLYSSQIDILDAVRDAVSEAGFDKEWKDATTFLSESVGIDLNQAEVCLAETWKWKSWVTCKSKIAKKYIRTVKPDSKSLQESLEWLKNGPLDLTNDQLQVYIANNPETYLLDPETTYKEALKAAPKEFSSPDAFRALLLEDPSVLACTYNCIDGGCASECGNCWVSYKNRI